MKIKQNIPYAKNFEDLRLLDIYTPSQLNQKKPVLIFIHGGGWRSGNKEQWKYVASQCTLKGHLCFSISYRLAPTWNFPAQIEDVRLAIAFIKKEISELGFQPNHFVLVGSSAGSHLALLAAAIKEGDYLGKSDELKDQRTQPKAVIAYNPVCSIKKDFHQNEKISELIDDLLNFDSALESESFLNDGSPYERAKDIEASILILQGDEDQLTTKETVQKFHDELIHSKVASRFALIQGAPHGFGYGLDNPQAKEALDQMTKFLAEFVI